MEIATKSTYEAWKAALAYVMQHGMNWVDSASKVSFLETLNLKITIESPSMDITKPITILNSYQQWSYPPLSEIKNIILNNELGPAYDYSYGHRIFNSEGLDQINDYIIPLLQQSESTRRAVITIWNPKIDSSPGNSQVPGLLLIDFKLRQRRLHATAIIRSNDIWFGWPANAYETFVLLDYIAKKIGVNVGTITTFSNSAHIRKDLSEEVQALLKRE